VIEGSSADSTSSPPTASSRVRLARDPTDWKYECLEVVQTAAKQRVDKALRIFNTIEPISIDLMADPNNAQVEKFFTKEDSVFDHTIRGVHAWGNPPFESDTITRLLEKVISDWKEDPWTTSFTICVPKWTTATWWPLVNEFLTVYEHQEDEHVFSAPAVDCSDRDKLADASKGRKYIGPTRWPVRILHLPRLRQGNSVEDFKKYVMEETRQQDECAVRRQAKKNARCDDYVLLHQRLGHVGRRQMRAVIDNELMPSVNVSANDEPSTPISSTCEGCLLMQASRPRMGPTPDQPLLPSPTRFGQTIMMDTCGPFEMAKKGERYGVIYRDMYSSFLLYCLPESRNGSLMVDKFKEMQQEVATLVRVFALDEGETADNTFASKHVISDRAREFVGGEFQRWARENSIFHETGAAYRHEHQGAVEGLFRPIFNTVRVLLHQSKLPNVFWTVAFEHAVWLWNRTPKKHLDWISPYEKAFGRKPDLSRVRVFGCDAYAWVDPVNRDGKLDTRSEKFAYVGNDVSAKSYKLMTRDGVVHLRGMSRFVEDRFTLLDESEHRQEVRDLAFDVSHKPGRSVRTVKEQADVLEHAAYLDPTDQRVHAFVKVATKKSATPIWTPVSGLLHKHARMNFRNYMARVEKENKANPWYPLFAFCRVPDRDRGGVRTGYVTSVTNYECAEDREVFLIDDLKTELVSQHDVQIAGNLFLAKEIHHAGVEVITEPTSVADMHKAPDRDLWIAAVHAEFKSHEENNTLTGVDEPPSGYSIVDMKLVFKVKLDADRKLDKRKVRAVVRGCRQMPGSYTIGETFAPTPQIQAVLTLTLLCTLLGVVPEQMDVPVAFQIPELKEEICVKMPDGMPWQGKYKYALLNKSVYGLKQAAFAWRDLSHKFILSYDARIKCLKKECCFYFIWSDDLRLLLVNYVDDYVGWCSSSSWWDGFMDALKKEYNIKPLGKATHILQIKIEWGNGFTKLTQRKHIQGMVERFGLTDANFEAAKTPMDVSMEDQLPRDQKKVDSLPYMEAIGGLLWVARCTRPDILYAVKTLSRFSATYTEVHFNAVKRVIKYLKRTEEWGLTFHKPEKEVDFANLSLHAYTDSNLAKDLSTRRSTSGAIVYLENNPITFTSMLQKSVALSTAEAELMALTEGVKDVQYMCQLLGEMMAIKYPVTIHVDSQGARFIAENDATSSRSKHIDIRYFYVRELVQDKRIQLRYIPSADNVADLFTKALPHDKHVELSKIALGMNAAKMFKEGAP